MMSTINYIGFVIGLWWVILFLIIIGMGPPSRHKVQKNEGVIVLLFTTIATVVISLLAYGHI